MRHTLAALALAAATAHPAFRYERPIELTSATAPETCVVLPLDLLSHAGPRLEDLRLLVGDREVAYQLRISSDAAEDVGRPQQILNLGQRNGVISFDVEMTEPRFSRVLLKMERSHFSVLVHITGTDRPGEAGVAFPQIPYSSDTPEDEPQMKQITLPESSFRFLHFEIQTLALDPVTPRDIAGVDVLVERAEPPRYLQAAVAAGPQQKPHETIYEFVVPPNVPLDRLTFTSDDPNAVFSRTAGLERYRSPSTRSETAVMPAQSEGLTLSRSANAKRQPASLEPSTIDLGLGAVPYPSIVRLTIQNGDDAPLALEAVTLQMRERQLCFLPKRNTSYTLRYGDPALGPPQYDLTPIEAAAANASVSTLGAERALTPETGDVRPFTERHPILLWVALILVVGTLGFVALRSVRSSSGIRD